MALPEIKRLGKNPTEADKWRYYAEVYAWRVVRGWGKEEDQTCPIDPDGEWYSPSLVQQALDRYRRILAAQRRAYDEHQSRDDDVQRQNEKYARGLAWRQGRLDEYDAIHHPEQLAERQRAQAQTPPPTSPNAEVISNVLDDLGISSEEHHTAAAE